MSQDFNTDLRVFVVREPETGEYTTEYIVVGDDVEVDRNGYFHIVCPECGLKMSQDLILNRAIEATEEHIEEEDIDADETQLNITYNPELECDHEGGVTARAMG